MSPNEYLNTLLTQNKLTEDSKEVEELRAHRAEVEAVIRSALSKCKPSIRYGGSKAKGTMVRGSYDLDLTCYIGCDDDGAGTSLEEIYNTVKKALVDAGYTVVEKTSAIRIRSGDVDFHVDVVPGRFFDNTKTDVWLHRTQGDKSRLKTNLDLHIEHVKKSGLQDAICLMKIWRERYAMSELRTFAIELLTIKLLDGVKNKDLPTQMRELFVQLKEHARDVVIEDPANPGGNDLSDVLPIGVRAALEAAASSALSAVDAGGWESVFGPLKIDDASRNAAVARAVATSSTATKPWCLI
jgi:hypothetical protein